jgi:DNA excision repair protein ERCC-2
VPEINKALQELKHILAYRAAYFTKTNSIQKDNLLALGLTSRRNLCIHPQISRETNGKIVDARCYSLTAPFKRAAAKMDSSIPTCDFFEALERRSNMDSNSLLKQLFPQGGAYSLDDIKAFGTAEGLCPYFLTRSAIVNVDILVYSYYYLLDPRISEIVSKHLSSRAIIVFDEAHNVDNVALEVLSVDLTRADLNKASKSCEQLNNTVAALKENDCAALQDEYKQLLTGLKAKADQQNNMALSQLESLGSPIIPEDLVAEAMPGNIRRAEHFVAFLKRLVEYLRAIISGRAGTGGTLSLTNGATTSESPLSFLSRLQSALLERRTLRHASERLTSLLKTLQLTNVDDLSMLMKVAHFGTLLATYSKGFSVIHEAAEQGFSLIYYIEARQFLF